MKKETSTDDYYGHYGHYGPPVETSSSGRLLDGLMAITNLQLVYNKVFPRTPLKKSYWSKEVRKINNQDYFTVVFRCPDQDGKEYAPSENAGIVMDGKWWYKSEKVAKAITFLSFLAGLVELGQLKDIQHTLDGRTLF